MVPMPKKSGTAQCSTRGFHTSFLSSHSHARSYRNVCFNVYRIISCHSIAVPSFNQL